LIQVFILEVTGGGFINDQKVKETLSTLQDMLDKDLKEQVDEKAYSDLGMLAKFINFLSKENQSYTKNLEKFSAAKSVFLASMSHEIRTPLNALLGTVQVLQRTSLSGDQRKMIDDLGQSGRLLLGLLNDILDFSKIEAGKMDVARESFDIYHVLSELESYFGYLARDKGLEFVIAEPENVRHLVIGDKLRVTQILTNLIGNAIKFTAYGHVDLRVEGKENKDGMQWIRFSIRDTGIGMDKDMQQKLFQAFTQGDGTITRRYGGTGLGLSISKKLVDLMGGQIGVESQLNQGSTFWFELPCQVDAIRDSAETLKRERRALVLEDVKPELVGCRVLVVDDNEMNRVMLLRLLSQEGVSDIHMAENGQLAVDILEKNPGYFDAVFMDVQMPVMDGLTATRCIRHKLGLPDLPILICSAGVYLEEQGKAFDAGANDFIPKPIQRQVMLDKLKAATAAKRSIVQLEPAPESPPSTVARWPTIVGIDVESVKAQVGDDPEFFFSMLDMFANNLCTIVVELPQQTGAEQQGAQMLHKLRGSAGTIGATALIASSRELEDAIKQQSPNLGLLLEHFLRQVQTLLQAIAAATHHR
jgi:signal transduction histidine kinase/DNA-binding response OmpR family regulator